MKSFLSLGAGVQSSTLLLMAAKGEFDEQIRKAGGMRGDSFLHRSLKPLAEVDFDKDRNQYSLWGNECEGMCGV